MIQQEPVIFRVGMTLHDVERAVVEYVMQHFQGNKTQTARSLDISVRGLELKMAKYTEQGRVEIDKMAMLRQHRRDHDLRARGLLPPLGGTATPEVEKILNAAAAADVDTLLQIADEQIDNERARLATAVLPISTTEGMPQRPEDVAPPDGAATEPPPKLSVAKRR